MRTRLLSGETALADYEIVEMLLFLGIPRRDTKPFAKSLINRFGSLAATLSAGRDALREAGLPQQAVDAFALVIESAAHLARPEQHERPVLASWDALDRHLARHADAAPGLHALLLNTRNQLVAEPRFNGDGDAATTVRDVLRHALDQHASALILVRHRPDAPDPLPGDHALLAWLQLAATPLCVTVHDMVVAGRGQWTSLRQPTR